MNFRYDVDVAAAVVFVAHHAAYGFVDERLLRIVGEHRFVVRFLRFAVGHNFGDDLFRFWILGVSAVRREHECDRGRQAGS